MLHDYHLYTCPGADPRGAARRLPPSLRPHPVVAAGLAGGSCPARWREEIYRGMLANDIIGFHTTAYCRNFLHCCRELMELEVDYERGAVIHDGRETWVRAYPLGDRRRAAATRAAASEEVAEYEQRAAARAAATT